MTHRISEGLDKLNNTQEVQNDHFLNRTLENGLQTFGTTCFCQSKAPTNSCSIHENNENMKDHLCVNVT